MISKSIDSPDTIVGITLPSTTRNPFTPITRSCGSTTAVGSHFESPILQVPTCSKRKEMS